MDIPDVIPSVELTGTPSEKLKALNAAIVRLHAVRAKLAQDDLASPSRSELYGPYINAPVWPWFAAGCIAGALFALLFVVAWLKS